MAKKKKKQDDDSLSARIRRIEEQEAAELYSNIISTDNHLYGKCKDEVADSNSCEPASEKVSEKTPDIFDLLDSFSYPEEEKLIECNEYNKSTKYVRSILTKAGYSVSRGNIYKGEKLLSSYLFQPEEIISVITPDGRHLDIVYLIFYRARFKRLYEGGFNFNFSKSNSHRMPPSKGYYFLSNNYSLLPVLDKSMMYSSFDKAFPFFSLDPDIDDKFNKLKLSLKQEAIDYSYYIRNLDASNPYIIRADHAPRFLLDDMKDHEKLPSHKTVYPVFKFSLEEFTLIVDTFVNNQKGNQCKKTTIDLRFGWRKKGDSYKFFPNASDIEFFTNNELRFHQRIKDVLDPAPDILDQSGIYINLSRAKLEKLLKPSPFIEDIKGTIKKYSQYWTVSPTKSYSYVFEVINSKISSFGVFIFAASLFAFTRGLYVEARIQANFALCINILNSELNGMEPFYDIFLWFNYDLQKTMKLQYSLGEKYDFCSIDKIAKYREKHISNTPIIALREPTDDALKNKNYITIKQVRKLLELDGFPVIINPYQSTSNISGDFIVNIEYIQGLDELTAALFNESQFKEELWSLYHTYLSYLEELSESSIKKLIQVSYKDALSLINQFDIFGQQNMLASNLACLLSTIKMFSRYVTERFPAFDLTGLLTKADKAFTSVINGRISQNQPKSVYSLFYEYIESLVAAGEIGVTGSDATLSSAGWFDAIDESRLYLKYDYYDGFLRYLKTKNLECRLLQDQDDFQKVFLVNKNLIKPYYTEKMTGRKRYDYLKVIIPKVNKVKILYLDYSALKTLVK